MPTRTATYRTLANGALQIEWTGLLNGDNGDGVELPWMADKTVEVFGTFGAGGSVSVKGTNRDTITPASDAALNNPQGTALALTTVGCKAILENPRFIYPHATAGDGSTSLTCRIISKPAYKG